MATTITGAIGRIKDALDAHFAAKGLEWKTEESQTVHTQAKPTVYALVCAERTGDNWPTACPSITIELREAAVNGERNALAIVWPEQADLELGRNHVLYVNGRAFKIVASALNMGIRELSLEKK